MGSRSMGCQVGALRCAEVDDGFEWHRIQPVCCSELTKIKTTQADGSQLSPQEPVLLGQRRIQSCKARMCQTAFVVACAAVLTSSRDSTWPRPNVRCSALTAFSMPLASTRKEMLYSEEPCAMAIILIPSLPIVLKTRPAMPGVPAMFSPTAATTATFRLTVTCSSSWWWTSSYNASRSAFSVRTASAACTTKQMLSCEDDCEIITMFARTEAVATNMRAEMSGTPMIPGPATVISATSRVAVTAFTHCAEGRAVCVILVPGLCGSKLLRIHTGMPLSITGRSVIGWSTFAPKNANSPASM